jgi:hypothetical protein
MLLTVRVSDWELAESGRILSVGDREQFWLTFEDVTPSAPVTEQVNVIRGVAVPLPSWPGAEPGRHPIQIDLAGGALYWAAAKRVSGPIEVAGTISSNDLDAPEGFPETSGVVRRVRMVWDDFVMSADGVWRSAGHGTRFEEVASTYIPVPEPTTFDPEVEAALRRRAREAYVGAKAAGRVRPGESFEGGLKVPRPSRQIAAGTTRTTWTGVLVDLATATGAGTG